jgi:hypothetical protein
MASLGTRVVCLNPHGCRRAYVSQIQALGIDLETLESMVSHADTNMTEHYLRVQEPKRVKAIALFSEEFAARKNKCTKIPREAGCASRGKLNSRISPIGQKAIVFKVLPP